MIVKRKDEVELVTPLYFKKNSFLSVSQKIILELYLDENNKKVVSISEKFLKEENLISLVINEQYPLTIEIK